MAALSSCIVTRATIGMRMTLVTEQLLQDGGAPEYVYHNRIEGRCAVFVWAKVMAAKDIHKEMLPMYGEHCLSRQAVHNSCRSSRKGEKYRRGTSSPSAGARAVCSWFRQQPQEFYAAGFQGLVKRWDKCLNLYGDYVEK